MIQRQQTHYGGESNSKSPEIDDAFVFTSFPVSAEKHRQK